MLVNAGPEPTITTPGFRCVHPQADAIQVLGWIGLITLGVPWLIALVWAYTKPFQSGSADSQLAERVNALENQLQQLTEGGKDS